LHRARAAGAVADDAALFNQLVVATHGNGADDREYENRNQQFYERKAARLHDSTSAVVGSVVSTGSPGSGSGSGSCCGGGVTSESRSPSGPPAPGACDPCQLIKVVPGGATALP
jgi:hypothetical protein